MSTVFLSVLLLGLLIGGLYLLWAGARLLAFGKPAGLPKLGEFSPEQVLLAKLPWGLTLVVVGAWLLMLPFAILAWQLPLRVWGPLMTAGLAMFLIGQNVAVRRISRARA